MMPEFSLLNRVNNQPRPRWAGQKEFTLPFLDRPVVKPRGTLESEEVA